MAIYVYLILNFSKILVAFNEVNSYNKNNKIIKINPDVYLCIICKGCGMN